MTRRLANVVVKKATAPDVVSVVQSAVRARETRIRESKNSPIKEPFDCTWAVFDIEHVHSTRDLESALKLARDEDVRLALSNPCFEFWLLLHFQYTTCAFEDRAGALRALRAEDPSYGKSSVDFAVYNSRLNAAMENAHRVREQHVKNRGVFECPMCRPSTDVDLLVGELLKFARV